MNGFENCLEWVPQRAPKSTFLKKEKKRLCGGWMVGINTVGIHKLLLFPLQTSSMYMHLIYSLKKTSAKQLKVKDKKNVKNIGVLTFKWGKMRLSVCVWCGFDTIIFFYELYLNCNSIKEAK